MGQLAMPGDIYAVEDAPSRRRVAIVFGARLRQRRLSAMLRDRVDTGIDLYRQGKVDKLLFSGDNGVPEYDEAGDMMAYAIAQGVDPQRSAGLRRQTHIRLLPRGASPGGRGDPRHPGVSPAARAAALLLAFGIDLPA